MLMTQNEEDGNKEGRILKQIDFQAREESQVTFQICERGERE